jgi:hypothetical protein
VSNARPLGEDRRIHYSLNKKWTPHPSFHQHKRDLYWSHSKLCEVCFWTALTSLTDHIEDASEDVIAALDEVMKTPDLKNVFDVRRENLINLLTMQNSCMPGSQLLGNRARDSDANYMDKCKLTVFWMPLSKYNGDPIKNGHIPYSENNVKGVLMLKRAPWVHKYKIGERRFFINIMFIIYIYIYIIYIYIYMCNVYIYITNICSL